MSTTLAKQLINEAYEKKSPFLDLGNCDLQDVPKEILKLKDSLQHLNLGSWYNLNNIYKESGNNLKGNSINNNVHTLSILLEFPNLNSLSLRGNDIGERGADFVSRLTLLKSLDISDNEVGDKGAQYISRLLLLSSLDISNNAIEKTGASYISGLSSLTSLILDGNTIGNKGAESISKLSLLTNLSLDNNEIEDEGVDYISRLSLLTDLSLNGNRFGENATEFISRLSLLTDLDLSRNNIEDKGAKLISSLSSLTSLNLGYNNIGNKGAEYISELSFLTDLDMVNNTIGHKGTEYLCKLSSLEHLNLANNNIGDKGAAYISKLTSLTSLGLYNSNIGDIGAKYISKLSSLTNLNLANNKISEKGAQHIGHLFSLTFLTLANNSIGDKGAEYIAGLSSLTYLSLENNNIGNEGVEQICHLSLLSDLNLAKNNISKFNPKTPNHIHTLHLQNNLFQEISLGLIKNTRLEIDIEKEGSYYSNRIFLHANPITIPPKEVIRKGREAVIEYLEAKLRPLNECKLIFVGDGGVGKTSLMKRLVYGEFLEGEKTTHGINKIAWKGFENDKGEPIKVNLWDFGGQHIQHSLHQFFFTERVVYVLVLNPRNDEKAGYWLDQVDKLGRNSQIVIVYNWKDKNDTQADFLRNFRELRKTYKYLPEPIILSCSTGEGMPNFLQTIKNAVLKNEGLKTPYPENWFNIKEKLETRIPIEKHYIKYDQYEEWCAEEQYNDPERRRNLLRILDSVGSIVFFDKPVLNELQVLNPEWISTGAYAIITAELTRKEKGHLTWDSLRTIFSEEKEIFSDKDIRIKYREPQFKFILQLMLDYRLCQKNPLVEHEYLIPSAFGEKPKKEYDITGGRHYRLKFQSPFEMLIIHQFISKNILNIISNDYWNSGIYFKHVSSNTFALVDTNQYSQVINCWIKGENIRGMWEVIRNDFREIFNMYHNLDVDEEVEYVAEDRSVFLKYDEMLAALSNGVLIIPYDPKTGLKNIDVILVLELFESPGQTKINMGNEQIKVEVNPQITVNPQFTNNPTFGVNYKGDEPEIVQSKKSPHDKKAEDLLAKRWKNKALTAFIFSIIITTLLIVIWTKKWILGAHAWNQFEQYDILKWSGIILGLIWNGFIVKIVYDRFFDPTKEKAFRESLRN